MTVDNHADTDPAVTVCFEVKVDRNELGNFTACEGLGCELVIEQREEGGTNGFVWQLPTRVKYTTIKLTRPVGRDTTKLTAWFAEMVGKPKPHTATIIAKTVGGAPVATWTLDRVVPVRWSGPSLNLDSPKVATETLELAHHGFLPDGGQ